MYIRNNANLTNVDGLAALTSVGVRLIIDNNAALTNVNGLTALTSVGKLFIESNANLTNVDGLTALTSAASLQIDNNAALTNVNGLTALTSVGVLRIDNNDALTNVDGLAALTSVGKLLIYDNAVLMRCCGLYPLLMYGEVTVSININNPIGCTYDDILYGGVCPDLITIMNYFNARVADGTIEGAGKHPLKDVDQYRKRLESADRFFDKNKMKPFCNTLWWCYERADELPKPEDLIAGDAVPNLADMIDDVIIKECN